MSVREFTFQVPGNYSFPATVEVNNGGRLVFGDDPLNFNQPFDSDTGFTLDPDKSEITGGDLNQKDQVNDDATVFATYSTVIDFSYSRDGGTLTGTAIGGASIVGGKLNLQGNKAVSYDGVNNIDWVRTGAVKFKYTPDFTGSPGTNRNLFSVADDFSANFFNYVTFFIDTAGMFRIQVRNKTSGVILNHTCGSAGAVLGVPMEILFSMDLITGNTFIRKDGVLSGTADTTTALATDRNNPQAIMVGAAITSVNFSGGEFEDLILYDQPQQVVDYTPGYTLLDTRYVGDVVTYPTFTYTGPGNVQGFTSFASTDINNPLYVMNGLYHNGAAWVSSDDSPAQANTTAQVSANIATLPASDTLIIKNVTVDSNTVQMSVSNVTVGYNGQIYSTTDPLLEVVEVLGLEGISDFQADIVESGNDSITFVQEKNGSWFYWDGGGNLVPSDLSLAQSNTLTEVQANIADFTNTGVLYRWGVIFHSDDGTTTPEINSITITFDFFAECVSPNTCVVYGCAKDIDGTANTLTFQVELYQDAVQYGSQTIMRYPPKTIEPRPLTGYFEIELVENINMEPAGQTYYVFTLTKTVTNAAGIEVTSTVQLNRIVPNKDAEKFWDLVEFTP